MSPSRLTDRDEALVLDASTILNLLGTSHAGAILHLVRRDVVMVDQAADEVLRDPWTNASGQAAVAAFETAGLLRKMSLSDTGYATYLSLVGAAEPSDSLDDGEAATVAHALDTDATALLDERKATRIAQVLMPSRPALCTLDLLSCPIVAAEFGAARMTELVLSALLRARMRVPAPFRAWVIETVGLERLRGCASIPRSWLVSPTCLR